MTVKDAITSLTRYRDQRVPVGGFLQAVLENKLKESFQRADESSARNLHDIVIWCYNELPYGAWGSEENVKTWLSR